MTYGSNKFIFILIILLPVLSLSGQTTGISDSLLNALHVEEEDSIKVKILQKLFWEYRRSDPEKALNYAFQSLQLSESINYTVGIANSKYQLGIIKKIQGDFLEASEIFQDAIAYFNKIHDTIGIVGCYTDLGDIYNRQNNYEKALVYFNEARKLAVLTGNKEKLSRIYSKLGGIYNEQKQYEKALEYHRKSLEINKELNFKLGMSVNYNNIGNVYLDLNQHSFATENYLKSLEIKKEINDDFGIASTLNNLGLIFSDQKNFKKALEYHNDALKKYKELGDKSGVAMCMTNVANDYLESGNFRDAVDFAQNGLNLSKELNLKRIQTESCRILSEAYVGLNQFEKAYQFQKLFKIYHDSTVSVELVSQITEMESRFEMEKKEKEIALLNSEKEKQELKMKQQRSQRNLMIGLTLLVLVVLVFLYWGYRNKKKLNTRLRELNLTKSRFFANISHEFRTPLTLLLGPLEKLMNSDTQENKNMIGMMHRNATRLLLLDNQLLDLSKLEAGKLSLKVSQSEITQAIKGMVMSFQSLAEKKEIDFSYLCPDIEIQAFFDQEKLEKIVYNLLSNALKFTPENGQVIFKLFLFLNNKKKDLPQKLRNITGQIICITVKDTGAGITKENQLHIFDRFYQVDSSQNKNFEGTGLGLSLTKELVELHHGYITVDSKPTEGSTFKVYLPIDKKAFETNELVNGKVDSLDLPIFKNNSQTEGKFHEQKTEEEPVSNMPDEIVQLLIVEDNDDMRYYIRDCFDYNFNIEEAVDGESGFEKAINEIPDIIISDLMMPKMDGIELCHNLKTDERTSHIPIILLTALSSVDDRIKGLETGADDYIAKPFNRQELVTRVKNLTFQRRLLRERFGREVKIQAKDIAITSADEKFLDKLILFIENNLADPDLNVDSLIDEIHLSRSQLHRKLKALTCLSATEFIRTIRLKRAAQLLEQHHGTVAETVYAVGFNSLSYFSKCFQKQFNMTPKEYIRQS